MKRDDTGCDGSPGYVVNGVAYDTPVPGYKVNTINFLRLWRAEAPESFDFQEFNVGDYYGAVEEKVMAENITKVLYPNDEPMQGKELRLQQQYFFCVMLAAGHNPHPVHSEGNAGYYSRSICRPVE